MQILTRANIDPPDPIAIDPSGFEVGRKRFNRHGTRFQGILKPIEIRTKLSNQHSTQMIQIERSSSGIQTLKMI